MSIKNFFILIFVAIGITFLTGLRKGVWETHIPTFVRENGQQRAIITYGEGKGFPFLYARTDPSLEPGTTYLGILLQNVLSFSGDILFWFAVSAGSFMVWKKVVKKDGKNLQT